MQGNNCFYCEDGEKRKSLMLEVLKLKLATVYLNRDQKHQGRCVLKLNEHKTDLSELSLEENTEFFKELRQLSQVLTKLYHPGKINYAIYGDLVPHLHVHVVPKYCDGLQWGGPFTDDIPKKTLSEDEYQHMVEDIKRELLALN